MKKEFTYDDVPLEVWEVWAIQLVGQPVGMKTWNRCNETIKRYPEYFPWEYKYDKIPKEVHQAYDREAHPERYEPLNLENREWFTGIIPNIPPPEPQPERTISEMFSLLVKQEREAEDRKRAEKKKAKAIWNKHYYKYDLEFRD